MTARACQFDLASNDVIRLVKIHSHSDAQNALLAVLRWADQESRQRAFNHDAVRESIAGVMNWLQPESSLDHTVERATHILKRLAEVSCDFAWLFDDEGDLKVSSVSPELFEFLVDARVVADRIQRAMSS